jgi:CAP12/Pycsar effector protein, TIR domain
MEEIFMQKPLLFVGSSSEGLDIANAVQLKLQTKAVVEIWNEGLFELGKGNLENLIKLLPKYDFAVLIATPDDAIESRRSKSASPRDNVLVELGMFVACLGRDRAFLLRADGVDLKIPSDFAGVSHATYDHKQSKSNALSAVGPACTLIGQAINKRGPLLLSSDEYGGLLARLTDNDVRALQYLEDQYNTRPGQIHKHLTPDEPIDFAALNNFSVRLCRLMQYGLMQMVGSTEVELSAKGKAFLERIRDKKEPKYLKLFSKNSKK